MHAFVCCAKYSFEGIVVTATVLAARFMEDGLDDLEAPELTVGSVEPMIAFR